MPGAIENENERESWAERKAIESRRKAAIYSSCHQVQSSAITYLVNHPASRGHAVQIHLIQHKKYFPL